MRQTLGLEENFIDENSGDAVVNRKLRSLDQDQGDKDEEDYCPKESPYLLGPLYVKQKDIPDLQVGTSAFEDQFSADLKAGGQWRPQGCKARTKLAVIIPYR